VVDGLKIVASNKVELEAAIVMICNCGTVMNEDPATGKRWCDNDKCPSRANLYRLRLGAELCGSIALP
jgi:hypothetical protein